MNTESAHTKKKKKKMKHNLVSPSIKVAGASILVCTSATLNSSNGIIQPVWHHNRVESKIWENLVLGPEHPISAMPR